MAGAKTKLVYLAPLGPDPSHEAFRERWRGHGELAMSLPQWQFVERYELNPAVTDPAAGGDALTPGYGGIGVLWIDDMPRFTAALDDGAGELLYKDELRVFGGLLGDNLQATREEIVYDEDLEPAFKLVTSLRRVPSIDRDEFARRWSARFGEGAEGASTHAHACRCVLNHTENEDPDVIDGFLELGFAGQGDLKSHLADPRALDLGPFVDPARSVVVPVSVNTVFVAGA